jgi:hypothetical protein
LDGRPGRYSSSGEVVVCGKLVREGGERLRQASDSDTRLTRPIERGGG